MMHGMEYKVVGLEKHKDGPSIAQFYNEENREYLFPIILNNIQSLEFSFANLNYDFSQNDLNSSEALKVGIIDSGILPEHPMFKSYIKNTIDFTGEGIKDRNGHGCSVTFLFLHNLLNSRKAFNGQMNIHLFVAKVLDENCEGTEENLIKAIDWLVKQKVDCANLSIGIDRTNFLGFNKCKGTCKLCKKAISAASEIIYFAVSAGNNKNTTCPARASIYFKDCNIHAIGAKNPKTNKKEKWSGEADRYLNGTFKIIPASSNLTDKEKASFYEQTAVEAWESGKHEDALKLYKRMLDCFDRKNNPIPHTKIISKIIKLCSILADKWLNNSDYKMAESYYQEQLKWMNNSSHNEDINLRFGSSIYLGMCIAKQKRYIEALHLLKNSESIVEDKKLKVTDRRLLDLYNLLGLCCLSTGQFELGIKYYKLAISTGENLKLTDIGEFIEANCNLAASYFYSNHKKEFKISYKIALALAQKYESESLVKFLMTLKY